MFENIPDLATHMNRRCPENNDLKRKREDDEDDYKESKKSRLEEQTIKDQSTIITRRHFLFNILMIFLSLSNTSVHFGVYLQTN
jgi:hypothetical protein